MLTILRHGTFQICDDARLDWSDGYASRAFVATGRSALYQLAITMRQRGYKRALLPGWVPDGVLLPFIAAGVIVGFYKLGRDLELDMINLCGVIGAGDLVVVIHYFGQVAETDRVIAIAHERGAMVLEDCAHALLHRPKRADFVLYSLNKFLPVPDGALLYSRRAAIDVRLPGILPPMPQEAATIYRNHLRWNGGIAAVDGSHTKDLAGECEARSDDAYEHYYAIMGNDLNLYAASPQARLALMADPRKLNPKPIDAYRLTPDINRKELARQLMSFGIYPQIGLPHWHVPSGHEPQDFLLVPSGTEQDVKRALGVASLTDAHL